jgi:indole-3-glycerol phosphate synthase
MEPNRSVYTCIAKGTHTKPMSTQPSILTRILTQKRAEIASSKATTPLGALAERVSTTPPVRDFAAALRKPGTTTLIAEIKKASPSRGVLREDFDHMELARTYMAHGASALSILTDTHFFQGSLSYLEQVRQAQATASLPQHIPLLRKDFLVDPYQVYEARVSGADALLLIVAALDDTTLGNLLETTYRLGMHALVEVHTAAEMERALAAGAQVIGVNNRDLHTFTTTLETTEQLAQLLPDGADRPLLVGESGIYTATDVARLHACGVDAVLVGEALVTAPDIAARVRDLAGV